MGRRKVNYAVDQKAYYELLSRYDKARGDYAVLADYLQKRLKELATQLDIYPIIMGRAKSLESFADKVLRKGSVLEDPLEEFTDLCGVRVITHTLDEVDIFEEAVKEQFNWDPMEIEYKQEALSYKEFGYLSRHFIIQLKEPPSVGAFSGEDSIKPDSLMKLKAELQLRTIAQHVWADIYHEMGYKNEFRLPERWEREFARLAAILEYCDKGFQEIKEAMGTYETSYSAYMSNKQLRKLAPSLETLRRIDRDNKSVLHRLIRTHLSLGNRNRLKEIIKDSEDSVRSYTPALRDMGVALCQTGKPGDEDFNKGQEYLRVAVKESPRDIDALCSLAGTCVKQGKTEESLGFYRRAYRLDPTNPYTLGNYVAEELLARGSTELIDVFRDNIEKSIERCLKQYEVQVNLPWALFDLGIFSLYLGEPDLGLSYYARGVNFCPDAWMIYSASKPIRRLVGKSIALSGLDLTWDLLKLGWWICASEKEKYEAEWPPLEKGRFENHAGQKRKIDLNVPVLVLAGGCAGLADEYGERLDWLKEGLRGFKGILVSGGTRSGISEVAGEIQEKYGSGRIETIGYLPADIGEEKKDDRYSCFRVTTGSDFSPKESLVFWEDYVSSGENPGNVKLVGFNGGKISACEYRFALAFGAKVGIVKGSGRAADELLGDPLWNNLKNLHSLSVNDGDLEQFIET
jgi:ppGpp synthetase/RelA/SpoT-type nucleotidyltranferase